jgi:E3 ubiquitin-protein ligase HUWE1
LFNIICEKGKVVLNMMIKEKLQDSKNPLNRYENPNKKSILSEPLGVIFLKQPKIIDFENKQKYFKQELKQLKLQNRHHVGNISLRVRRKDIFIDSFHHFSKKRTEELRVSITFHFRVNSTSSSQGRKVLTLVVSQGSGTWFYLGKSSTRTMRSSNRA